MANEKRGTSKHDPAKDRYYALWKASDGRSEGVKIELVSYDGATPRIKMTRYYLDMNATDKKTGKKGVWTPDYQRTFPRFTMQVLKWLIQSTRELEDGFEKWQAEVRASKKGGRK